MSNADRQGRQPQRPSTHPPESGATAFPSRVSDGVSRSGIGSVTNETGSARPWSRLLLDRAPYGVLVMRLAGPPPPGGHADFLCLYANPAVAVQTGLTDPSGDTVGERLPADQSEQWNALYEQVWRTGVTVRRVQSLVETGRELEIDAFAIDSADTDLVEHIGGEPERLVAMILTDITSRTEDEREHRRTAEIALALQHAMLDSRRELPANIAVRYRPAHDELARPRNAAPLLLVGGDFHDVVPLPGDRCALVVGDVVGKGLQAATVMGQLRSAARVLLLDNRGPAQALTSLDTFAGDLDGAFCTTVFCAVVHRRTGHIDYASAGHVPALLSEPGVPGHRRLGEAMGPPLGAPTRRARGQAGALLSAGSLLLLYTDGLVEARGRYIDDGIDRAGALLADLREQDLDTVAGSLLALTAETFRSDDTALLLYRQSA
ncbi:PP2C family protein-serine/threonine phosphatase [Amycolatopsis sp. NPDC004378]